MVESNDEYTCDISIHVVRSKPPSPPICRRTDLGNCRIEMVRLPGFHGNSPLPGFPVFMNPFCLQFCHLPQAVDLHFSVLKHSHTDLNAFNDLNALNISDKYALIIRAVTFRQPAPCSSPSQPGAGASCYLNVTLTRQRNDYNNNNNLRVIMITA